MWIEKLIEAYKGEHGDQPHEMGESTVPLWQLAEAELAELKAKPPQYVPWEPSLPTYTCTGTANTASTGGGHNV